MQQRPATSTLARVSAPTILLLDDDVRFRALVRPALTARGLQVVEASKGRDALAAMARVGFDLAIVDGLLPDTSGVTWIERVRANGATLPIVFVSAFYRDLESYRRLTQDLGVAEVMHKPLDPELLADTVEGRLPPRTRRKRRRSLTAEPSAGADQPLPREDMQISRDIVFVSSEEDGDGTESEELALRRSYESVLPHILALFLRSLRHLREAPAPGPAAEEALRQAHDLAGTAGSYGFAELGRAAAAIEREVRRLREHKPVDWATWDAAVESLARSPQAASAEPSEPLLVGELDDAPLAIDIEVEWPPEGAGRSRDGDDRAETRPRRRRRSLPSSAVPASSSRLLGPRLLVADDDPSLVEYVTSALEGTLAVVVEATTVEQAAAAGHLDAALVGVPFGTPDRSAEVVALLKRGRSSLPVGLLGLEDSWEARRRAAEAGADRYLSHPLDHHGLRRAVHSLECSGALAPVVHSWGAERCAGDLSRAGLRVQEHAELDALFEAIQRDRPDVVILGGDQAAVVAAAVRMTEGGEDLALLAVDAPTEVLERGADALLVERSRWAAIVRAHGRRAAARRRRGADPHTGLAHRSELAATLQARLSEALRHDRSFSLAVLEIDDYPGLEEREGAAVAQRFLWGAAKLAAARFRLEDVRGLGGPGMLVCGFADSDATAIAPAVRRLQREIGGLAVTGRRGQVRATASAGIASAPQVCEDLRSLALVAEGRLRLAQKSGPQGLAWTG